MLHLIYSKKFYGEDLQGTKPREISWIINSTYVGPKDIGIWKIKLILQPPCRMPIKVKNLPTQENFKETTIHFKIMIRFQSRNLEEIPSTSGCSLPSFFQISKHAWEVLLVMFFDLIKCKSKRMRTSYWHMCLQF